MRDNLVSIIVPGYNVKKYIDRCLHSLVHQTYTNLQIIVVDDGSTDASYEAVLEFLKKDSRIEIYRKDHEGVSAARNFALKKVKGKYICFVDADDWVSEDYVEVLWNQLGEDSDISYAGFDVHYDNGSRPSRYPVRNITLSSSEAIIELCRNTWMPSFLVGKMYRAELFDGVFFETRRVYEDVSIMHLLFSKMRNISCTSRVVYHYYMRSDSITHQNTSKNNMDFFLGFLERYHYVADETAKCYALKSCIEGCYRILYLSDGLVYDEEDLKLVKSFWVQHKNVKKMGLKCYLMCKHPKVCRFLLRIKRFLLQS